MKSSALKKFVVNDEDSIVIYRGESCDHIGDFSDGIAFDYTYSESLNPAGGLNPRVLASSRVAENTLSFTVVPSNT
jgi:hypothetical protein